MISKKIAFENREQALVEMLSDAWKALADLGRENRQHTNAADRAATLTREIVQAAYELRGLREGMSLGEPG